MSSFAFPCDSPAGTKTSGKGFGPDLEFACGLSTVSHKLILLGIVVVELDPRSVLEARQDPLASERRVNSLRLKRRELFAKGWFKKIFVRHSRDSQRLEWAVPQGEPEKPL